jgi:hypothetical protein
MHCLKCKGFMIVERHYTLLNRRLYARCLNCGFWLDLADLLRFHVIGDPAQIVLPPIEPLGAVDAPIEACAEESPFAEVIRSGRMS